MKTVPGFLRILLKEPQPITKRGKLFLLAFWVLLAGLAIGFFYLVSRAVWLGLQVASQHPGSGRG